MNGCLQAFVEALSRDAVEDAPVHDRIQRLLIAASLQPLCTVDEMDQQHPLQSLLELLLRLPTMAAPSPAVRDGRIRFAAHFGLALVSLNAVPGNPGAHHCLFLVHLMMKCSLKPACSMQACSMQMFRCRCSDASAGEMHAGSMAIDPDCNIVNFLFTSVQI